MTTTNEQVFQVKGMSCGHCVRAVTQAVQACYGLDEALFPDALKVDFDRPAQPHAAFGNGPHRCPGSFLARTEIRVFIEEWLRRIPDFSVLR